MRHFLLSSVALFGAALAVAAQGPVVAACPGFMVPRPTTAREVLENALQRLRYANHASDESAAETALFVPLRDALDRWLENHGLRDHQRREERIDDVFLEMRRRLRQAHRAEEPARRYVPLLYTMARHQMYRAFGERSPRPVGALDGLPDGQATPSPTDRRGIRDPIETLRPYEAPHATPADYPGATGRPIPLSERQLAVLRSLASGETHRATAAALGIELRQVHDSIGNVERKAQEALADPALRRSRMEYLPDVSSPNRVLIVCTAAAGVRTLVAEGPLAAQDQELPFLARWIAGGEVREIGTALGLDAPEARRIYLRLLIERRHDYQELFGAKEGSFAAILDAQLPESEGEYALYRAFGLERPEIATALGLGVRSVAARRDRLVDRLKHVTHLIDDEISFLRPYFSAVGDARDQVRIVLTGASGAQYLVRGRIVNDRTRVTRLKQSEPIPVDRAELVRLIGAMEGRLGEVMRMRVLENRTTETVAEALGIRIDTTRKYMADGTFRLGMALRLPELNLFNLRIR